jgi:hypothetical protein
MVAMSGSAAVPPAVSVAVGLRMNGRLELPGVETKAKLMVAVRLMLDAKLLMLARLSVDEAVVKGPLRKTTSDAGTAVSEKSGTPTVTEIVAEWVSDPLIPVTVTV